MSTTITEAIIGLATSHGLDDEQAKQAAQLISDLPQRKHITDETVLRWVESVCAADPKRLRWHARRLGGFGGSDIGALVLGYRGESDFFSNPRAIVASKLMLDPPDEVGGDAKRGVYLEPMIRDNFRAKYSAEPLTSERNAMLMSKPLGTDTDPSWLYGEPDDVVAISGHTYIVDYKSPRPSVLEECRKNGVVKFEYSCQLHQMRLLALRAQVKPDGLLLAAHDMIEWDLDVREVPHDPQLEVDILEAGNKYWNEYVMQGILPAVNSAPEFDLASLPADQRAKLDQFGEQYVAMRQVEKAAKESATLAVQGITEITKAYQVNDQKIVLPGSSVAASHSLDPSEVQRLTARLGDEFDQDKLTSGGQTYLAELFEKIKTALPEDAGTCIVESHSVSMSRARSGPQRDLIDKHYFAAQSMCNRVTETIVISRAQEGPAPTQTNPTEQPKSRTTQPEVAPPPLSEPVSQPRPEPKPRAFRRAPT